jgi:regulator of sigma E protease
MTDFLLLLLATSVANVIYTVTFFLSTLWSGMHHSHYFYGYNPHLFSFYFRRVRISIGVYIPIPGLAKAYYIHDKFKKPLPYVWEFRSYSALKKIIVTFSGTIALTLAGLVFTVISVLTSSQKVVSRESLNKAGIYPSTQAKVVGFKVGDKVLKINGKDFNYYHELLDPQLLRAESSFLVLRGHEQVVITIPKDTLSPSGELFLQINAPFEIGRVSPGSPAEKAGIKPGDRVLEANGEPIASFQEFTDKVSSTREDSVSLVIRRGNEKLNVTTALDYENKIGISMDPLIEYTTFKPDFRTAAQAGVYAYMNEVGWRWKYFTLFHTTAQLRAKSSQLTALSDSAFLNIASALISICAFTTAWNLLPFPKSAALELIPIIYERITRRPFLFSSFKVIRRIAVLLLILTFVVQFVLDVARIF